MEDEKRKIKDEKHTETVKHPYYIHHSLHGRYKAKTLKICRQ
jgi:hypothetical protein